MTAVDYLVVGSGLTGSTIARLLADQGREVLILERRSHLGGNVFDLRHPSQIRIHAYGPHYFRCSSSRIWKFVNRFDTFYPYSATVKSLVNGRYEDWPLNRDVLDCSTKITILASGNGFLPTTQTRSLLRTYAAHCSLWKKTLVRRDHLSKGQPFHNWDETR